MQHLIAACLCQVSVLETFVHDPLVDWTKHDYRANTEIENPQAQEAITIVQGMPPTNANSMDSS